MTLYGTEQDHLHSRLSFLNRLFFGTSTCSAPSAAASSAALTFLDFFFSLMLVWRCYRTRIHSGWHKTSSTEILNE